MAKLSQTEMTILAAQNLYEEEVRKLLSNWSKLIEQVRAINALIDTISTATEPARAKAPTS